MFTTNFAETIFNQKYRSNSTPTWAELAKVLVERVCGKYMTKDEVSQLTQYVTDLKFVPGGRYLYYAGRQRRFYNNCLTGDTQLYTDAGLRQMNEFEDGAMVNVLSPVTGSFLPATMHYHGKQPVQEITFAPVRGRSTVTWTVTATKNHHWPLIDGSDTYDIRIGDVVPAGGADFDTINATAFVHGMVYADGAMNGVRKSDNIGQYQLRLCGSKAKYASYIEASDLEYTRRQSYGDDPNFGLWSYSNLKKLPAGHDPEYVASFIKGWLALDGHKNHVMQIHSTDEYAINWFSYYAPYAGFMVSGNVKCITTPTNYGERKPLYYVNYKSVDDWQGFKVVSIKDAGIQDVWCPYEPQHNRIVLAKGIDTYQCYLLKSEEDTRQDWANLSWKAEQCLMTGGGIGNDYSIYRPRGQILHGTGGTASGPLPKMDMVNSIGRNVMQGGSRRSAIYASLNWAHGDVHDFLVAKDWHNMQVGSSGFTLWDIKQQDFNFPAPLDMTNISVNYDTAWLMNYWKTGDVGEIFKKNVEQALKTGEPGFSFNFFEKENETLRNACTEVTSADDSDVCNLGSINLGRIDSIEEFSDVIELAIKFLMCGTLEAELPYEKVATVRGKNRRLGLGLMGVHEWLVKRSERYEVSDELHRWLATYRGQSDGVSRSFADAMGISRPVANRAIAPTGTIAILAGTTTGIEPLYAVAYKRRFLTGGTRWKYQYTVDGAAQQLIEHYGVDPDKLESAADLATDFERRIKFQADVQDYVDMSISSTINMPAWGTEGNNEGMVADFANILASYAHRLRGFTAYPDGARGGQPITAVPYSDAVSKLGETFDEHVESHDLCDITGKGICGV